MSPVKENPLKNKGILLVNKPAGKTSFDMVAKARKCLGEKKIGHAGTLDPFATGLLILLVGREYTRLSDRFLNCDKEYVGTLRLGKATDSHDIDGEVTLTSDKIPTLQEVEEVIARFQGKMEQIPPMFSAKKVGGKKLYELARKGQTIERAPCQIELTTELVHYEYPNLTIRVSCTKGTYIRVLADDIGKALGSYAHLEALERTRCGPLSLDHAVDGLKLDEPDFDLSAMLNASVS